jgi:hypothetical protein
MKNEDVRQEMQIHKYIESEKQRVKTPRYVGLSTTARRVLGLRMEETSFRYGG